VIVKQTRALAPPPAPGAPAAPPPPPPRRLGVYYVLDGAVYQAPPLHAVFSSRLVRRLAFAFLRFAFCVCGC